MGPAAQLRCRPLHSLLGCLPPSACRSAASSVWALQPPGPRGAGDPRRCWSASCKGGAGQPGPARSAAAPASAALRPIGRDDSVAHPINRFCSVLPAPAKVPSGSAAYPAIRFGSHPPVLDGPGRGSAAYPAIRFGSPPARVRRARAAVQPRTQQSASARNHPCQTGPGSGSAARPTTTAPARPPAGSVPIPVPLELRETPSARVAVVPRAFRPTVPRAVSSNLPAAVRPRSVATSALSGARSLLFYTAARQVC